MQAFLYCQCCQFHVFNSIFLRKSPKLPVWSKLVFLSIKICDNRVTVHILQVYGMYTYVCTYVDTFYIIYSNLFTIHFLQFPVTHIISNFSPAFQRNILWKSTFISFLQLAFSCSVMHCHITIVLFLIFYLFCECFCISFTVL